MINIMVVFFVIKMMSALGWSHAVYDIKGAYLHAPRTHPKRQFMKLTGRFLALWLQLHPEDAGLVQNNCLYVLLNKALYGLKDSGKVWYDYLSAFLHRNGFTTSTSDPCMYMKYVSPTDCVYVLTHVDDLFVTGLRATFTTFGDVLATTFKEFTCKTGATFSYLGMSIARNVTAFAVTINQRPYITTMLTTFGMLDCTPVASPSASDLLLAKEDVSGPCDTTLFLSLVMSLMYLARISRPDILFPTTYLATKSAAPTVDNMTAGKRILRYLKGTIDLALRFMGTNIDLVVYADASHGIYADRKGHCATVFVVGGDEVVKTCQRMKYVSLSSTESELIAAVDAATYFRWLITLFQELGAPIKQPITLMQDNQSTIHMLTHGVTFKKAKHMVIKTHFARSLIEDGIIKLQYCPTDEMYADAYTKPYHGQQLIRYTTRIMVRLPTQ